MLSGMKLGDRYPRTTLLRWLCRPSLTRTHAGNTVLASADRRANDTCDVSSPPHLHACCLSSLRLSDSSISAGRATFRALILITYGGGLAARRQASLRSGARELLQCGSFAEYWLLAMPADLSPYHGLYLNSSHSSSFPSANSRICRHVPPYWRTNCGVGRQA